MPLLIPILALSGGTYFVLDKGTDAMNAATRLTIALAVAGGAYLVAKQIKLVK